MDPLCTIQVLFFLAVALMSFVRVSLEKIISTFEMSLKPDVWNGKQQCKTMKRTGDFFH